MLPKWSSDYNIGNPDIDAQHQKLFELAGNVEALVDRSINRGEIKDLLTEFFQYMKEHFNNEEKYMEKINYPELEPHRKIHKEIIQSMVHLISTIKTTNDLKERLYLITKKWLLEHILFEDMKITEYLRTLPIDETNISDDIDETSIADDEEITYINDENEEHQGYYYLCACEGKIHDVSLEKHQKIQVSKKDIRCKECNETIKFFKKEEH